MDLEDRTVDRVRGQEGGDRRGQILHIEERDAEISRARDRDHAPTQLPEEAERGTVARAVDRGGPQDRPPEASAPAHELDLARVLARRVGRDGRRPRGEGGDEKERRPRRISRHGLDEATRPRGVDRVEVGGRRRPDEAGAVDDGIGPFHEPPQAAGVLERAGDGGHRTRPFDPGATRQNPESPAFPAQVPRQMVSDEPGRSGERDGALHEPRL